MYRDSGPEPYAPFNTDHGIKHNDTPVLGLPKRKKGANRIREDLKPRELLFDAVLFANSGKFLPLSQLTVRLAVCSDFTVKPCLSVYLSVSSYLRGRLRASAERVNARAGEVDIEILKIQTRSEEGFILELAFTRPLSLVLFFMRCWPASRLMSSDDAMISEIP